MQSWKKYVIGVISLVFMTGCVVRVHPGGPDVAVEPGYYYDDAYVDVYHVYHPRYYYYYHDGYWEHRGFVPHGYIVHARAYRGYR